MRYLDCELLPEGGEEAGEQNSDGAQDIICRVIIIIFHKLNLSKAAKRFRFWICGFH